MSGWTGLTMLPTVYSTSSPNSNALRTYSNTPEEDDETMSHQQSGGGVSREPPPSRDHHGGGGPRLSPVPSAGVDSRDSGHAVFLSDPSCSSFRPPRGVPAGFTPPTPFPSRADGSWLHPSLASGWSGDAFPSHPPSASTAKDYYPSHSGESFYSGEQLCSLPGRYSPGMTSLEQPYSLHSNPPSADMHHHTMSPCYFMPQGAACCAHIPAEALHRGPVNHQVHHPPYGPYYLNNGRPPAAGSTNSGPNEMTKQKNPTYSVQLSLEQRKVFVTYEADSDKHVNEIINFVALLRHNGFDTHIDMFEQQFRSISKIDFMERYLSEKEYLIIVVISPKYFETVTASPFSPENDERTFNTVYIHKQLQNEFIQNGSKNFRFIPVLFPGARKCHVPTWLQNTHVFSWPRDRDDILRRLMRVEKYNPPPIGELPTIFSIPI